MTLSFSASAENGPSCPTLAPIRPISIRRLPNPDLREQVKLTENGLLIDIVDSVHERICRLSGN